MICLDKNKNGMDVFVKIFGSEKAVKTLPIIGFFLVVLSGIRPFINESSVKFIITVIIFIGFLSVALYSAVKFILYKIGKG